jgi:CRP-like cAMP-binding protein
MGGDYELLRPHLRDATLRAGQVLSEPGEPIRSIFFLHQGAVSKLAVFEDGAEIECALVGRDGAVGVASTLGAAVAVTRDICHVEAQASQVEAQVLRDLMRASERIHCVVDRYCAHKMTQAMRNGACNARHSVEQRLSRWLLTCADVLEAKEIRLSQDVFAKMLGVQRTSINPILQRLKSEGLIALGRARLTIEDRASLVGRACECYEAMRADADEFTRDATPECLELLPAAEPPLGHTPGARTSL